MSDGPQPIGPAPAAVTRARDGRIIAGVCAGLPAIAGLGTTGLRVAFCLAALCGGIGIVVYAACWLVIPDVSHGEDDELTRGPVLLAWVAGGLVAVLLLAGAGALAAALGLGWVVLAVAGALLAIGLSPQVRVPSQAALLAVAALALPATAVALSPARIDLQFGASVSRPATAGQVRDTVFRSGFGTRLIDLRDTSLPRSGSVPMRIEGGLRRTIVALPSNRCVHVVIRYRVHTFLSQFAMMLTSRSAPPFRDVVLFNHVYGASTAGEPHGVATSGGARPGPTLQIDFSSLGGSLFVRNYPDAVAPQLAPDWPGYPVALEPRPDLAHETRRAAREMIRDWRRRLAQDRFERRLYDRDQPGPCA